MERVLVTGASGQIGSELVDALRARLGADSVLATDLRSKGEESETGGPFRQLDCTDPGAVDAALADFRPDTIFHLAALLSAVAERDPAKAWEVNIGGLLHVLNGARAHEAALFVPSSIAAFGPETPGDPTPQVTIQRPTSIYGVTKVAGELLCDYQFGRYGVDTRGLRFPGIISHRTEPGGGTTDWAVEIYHAAVRGIEYRCFVRPDTRLDMMYIEDAIRASIEVMESPAEAWTVRNAYNVTAIQVTPEEMAESIRHHLPGFRIRYEPDPVRQRIADSWPDRLDDSVARDAWGWSPRWDLAAITAEMLDQLEKRKRSEAISSLSE